MHNVLVAITNKCYLIATETLYIYLTFLCPCEFSSKTLPSKPYMSLISLSLRLNRHKQLIIQLILRALCSDLYLALAVQLKVNREKEKSNCRVTSNIHEGRSNNQSIH